MPRLVLVLRSTSAKRTLSSTCGSSAGTFTRSRFTTFPSVSAMPSTRSADATSFTVPRRKTVSLSKVTLISAVG